MKQSKLPIMHKTKVIQEIIKAINGQTYLEIGVAEGSTFVKIWARRKYAVDPNLSIQKKLKRYVYNPTNVFNRYFEVPSNSFFETQQSLLKQYGLDVVFVDGLHTYSQAFKDVENSLRYLNAGGVIVMHDCSPPYEAAAVPALSLEHAASLNVPGWTGSWNGDVWKSIVYLRATRKDLRICVLDCDEGLGLITRGQPDDMLGLSLDEVESMSYKQLDARRKELLNLKDIEYFGNFLRTIRSEKTH